MIRIDDRLIHGQVIAVWCRYRQVTHILVTDDETAADPFLREILKLAAPLGINVQISTINEGIRMLKEEPLPRETTMVLMRSPQAAMQLYKGGVKYTSLNIGGLGMRPGRKLIYKNIALSEEEIKTLKALMEKGVTITLMALPGENPKDLADLLQ